MNARSGRNEGGDIKAIITQREVSALRTILSASSMSNSDKNEALKACIAHWNEAVRDLAARHLVSRGIWDAAKALAYAQESGRWGAWNAVVPGLRNEPTEIAVPVARAAAKELRKSANPCSPAEVALLNDVVRMLVKSSQPEDYELLLSLASVFADETIVWLAISRGEPSAPVRNAAGAVYENRDKPVPLRASAALVWGQQDPNAIAWAFGEALAYVRNFGSPGYQEQLRECYRNPMDPSCHELGKGLQDGHGLLGVLLEMPETALRTRVAELCRYHAGAIGAEVCAVLARRIPAEFVDAAAAYAENSGEVQRALLLASLRHPALRERVESLIPPDDLARLREEVAASGEVCLVPTLPNVSLWE